MPTSEPAPGPVPRYGSAFSRRTLLASAAGLAGAAGVAGAAGLVELPAAYAEETPRAAADAPKPARFAVVTDTHTDLTTSERTADLARVMRHIASRDPDFVLNCGDVTDYGVEDEFALYRSTIPDSLAPRVHHVPGNHECQWNSDAWEAYREHFGPTHYSFDAAGLHVVAMDPLVSQQWPPWNFGDRLIAFLRADLAKVRPHTPIVLFDHLPLDDTRFYVCNEDELHRLIEPYSVRLIFAGHIHYRQVYQYNGLTQVVGDAVIRGPIYYWAERITDADGDRLVVSEVRVPADGEVTEAVVATAPLEDPGPGGALGPLRPRVTVAGANARVDVQAPTGTGVAQVSARVYPLGVPSSAWVPLVLQGSGRWSGTLDVSTLAPGSHRLQLQSTDATGIRWSTTTPLKLPAGMGSGASSAGVSSAGAGVSSAGAVRVVWERRLGRTVMADLACHGDLVVVGTTDGLVEAFTPSAKGTATRWRRELAGVFKAATFAPDGQTVLVGSTDHHLYAVQRGSGRTVWRRDLGASITCGTSVLSLGGHDRIVVAAGNTLHCLALDGAPVWTADLSGVSAGLATTDVDGTRVYVGSGDGQAYALDSATGAKVWSTQCAKGGDAYHLLLESPWTARMRMLPTGDVLAVTASAAVALDAANGTVRWRVDGLTRTGFTPPIVDQQGVLVIDGKVGPAYLLDPATGATRWTDTTLPGAPGAGANWGVAPIPAGKPSVYWMASSVGLLTRMDLAARTVTPILQYADAFGTSTPARVSTGHGSSVLVTVDNNGVLRGITGLESLERA